jgi:hypothetical protein
MKSKIILLLSIFIILVISSCNSDKNSICNQEKASLSEARERALEENTILKERIKVLEDSITAYGRDQNGIYNNGIEEQTGVSTGGGTEIIAPTNPTVLEGNDFSGPPKNGNNIAPNPFGTGGGNGNGQGKFGGPGSGEGGGNEDGPNSGFGMGENRIRKNDPILDKFKTDVDITINLKLIINSSGKVVSAKNIASKTTTTDARIINGVISEVMKQVLYDEKKNARDEYVYITCKIRAQ